MKSLTVTLPEEVARWARRKAADENTSVSRLIRRIVEEHMRREDEYQRAYARWKQIGSLEGASAAGRLNRDRAHERR